jgi:predicted DNA-binding protein (MmcQ/YjbR family)
VQRDALIAYCLAKPGAWLDEPWEGDEARELRTRYPDHVRSSAYVGRYGWNTIVLRGMPPEALRELVDASYDAAVAALPRARRPM